MSQTNDEFGFGKAYRPTSSYPPMPSPLTDTHTLATGPRSRRTLAERFQFSFSSVMIGGLTCVDVQPCLVSFTKGRDGLNIGCETALKRYQ